MKKLKRISGVSPRKRKNKSVSARVPDEMYESYQSARKKLEEKGINISLTDMILNIIEEVIEKADKIDKK